MKKQPPQTPEAVPKPSFDHLIEAQQFTRRWLEELFLLAGRMEKVAQAGGDCLLAGKRLFNLFYEPSTRTRISFESAMHLLGGSVSGTENARQFSSAIKGETLEDTITILNGYFYDVIVLRYDEEGGASRAAKVSQRAAIINAGDGPGQHPTQALLDVYTIQKSLGRIDGLSVGMVGDLTYGRTVHSLAYLLTKFRGVKQYFISPKALCIQPKIREYLDEHKIHYQELQDLREVAERLDVVYLTRAQTERMAYAQRFDHEPGQCILDRKILEMMKPEAIVMHPLPRNEELPNEVMEDPRVIVFNQAQNGLFVRMALLRMLLRPDLG